MTFIKRLFILSAICILFSSMLSVFAKEEGKQIYASNRNAGKYVALTFDDGPHPEYTDKILDILKKYNAKATFFVIGKNVQSYPEILLREHNEGHEIGNHTYSHPDMRKIGVDEAIQEIEKTQNIVFDITGIKPKVFRSPGGIFSDELICRVDDLNCKSILWSWKQDTNDWKKPRAKNIADKVIKNLQDGDIILFHDFNTKGSPTPEALEIIIPKLIDLGYSFVTVSELLQMNVKL